ncbi:MAG: hypothetical protein ACOYOK_10490 [Pseudobdellovibrionaceae bacterium]
MNTHTISFIKISSLTASVLLMAACAPSGGGSAGNGQETSAAGNDIQSAQGDAGVYGKMAVDVNLHPLTKTVCDPFGDNRSDHLKSGLTANLFYQTKNSPRFYSTDDYMTKAKMSEQKLFFMDLNVPTRLFNTGFMTSTRDVLKDDQGQKLIEYFGLKFETVIRLSEDDAPGNYEFALLSDDGSKMTFLNSNKQNEVLIDNDGDHPTKMGCSNKTIYMDDKTNLSSIIQYYQGPRMHIANVLLWRKSDTAGKDSACGSTGNNVFFDPDNGSRPQKAYLDLLARGWKVVDKKNYFIPQKEVYNPCTAGTQPVVSNVKIEEVFMDGATVTWTTDIPATAQLKVTNLSTGRITLTTTDNLLRTQQSIQITGLQAQTAYSVQVVSISADLGEGISDAVNFMTP